MAPASKRQRIEDLGPAVYLLAGPIENDVPIPVGAGSFVVHPWMYEHPATAPIIDRYIAMRRREGCLILGSAEWWRQHDEAMRPIYEQRWGRARRGTG